MPTGDRPLTLRQPLEAGFFMVHSPLARFPNVWHSYKRHLFFHTAPRAKDSMSQKFSFGRTVITRSAQDVLTEDDVREALRRHAAGDWGELGHEDRQANELALKDGSRLFSRYRSTSGRLFYVVTESDRSATTVLLPEDY